MKTFTRINIASIPKEEAHGGSGKRQVLVNSDHMTSPHFEMMTKGFLAPGSSYDWHEHTDTDEIFIVLRGRGKFYWEDEVTEYSVGDVITTPANSKHKITAEGDDESEFYFIRVRA